MIKNILMLLLVLTGMSHSSFAQSDARATAILQAMSKKYKTYAIVKADFTMTAKNPKANINQTDKGVLYVQAKANKYKMVMQDREMISDGKNQWTHLKEDQEVQLSTVENDGDALNPAQIFTIYEKGFKAKYAGEAKSGAKIMQLIDLTPTDAKKTYNRVRLTVDKKAQQISKAVIYEKNGSTYTYNINSFVPNVKLPESIFTFDAKKYPGVEVVDLR
jgi:outer membrane lipoprotein-sorting protein